MIINNLVGNLVCSMLQTEKKSIWRKVHNKEVSNKNNYISIAKAIGILLMVAGHAGCPDFVCRYIYMFHMPLFFFCSGYFLRQPKTIEQLRLFVKHRISGLYLPYVKWSILFLLFHNIFYEIGFYSRDDFQHYTIFEFGRRLLHIISSMNGHEPLLDPFWFLKQLFLSSLVVYFLLYLLRRLVLWYRLVLILFVSLILSVIFKHYHLGVPIIWDLSIVFLSAVFYMMGHIYRNVEKTDYYKWNAMFLSAILLAFVVWIYDDSLDMLWYNSKSLLLYVFSAPLGILITFCASYYIEKTSFRRVLYYIGNHTMPILVFHLLAFKLVSYLRIQLYDLPIEMLASNKALYPHNDFLFIILYCFVGVFLPLLIDYILRWCKKLVYCR